MGVKHKNKQQGFTLIEIMIVVVIVGILASVIAPKLFDKPVQARIIKAKHDIKTLSSVLGLYKLDNYNYPSTDKGLQALVGKYIQQLPKDPWGKGYIYVADDEEYQLYSYGADGVAGGSGDNQDVK